MPITVVGFDEIADVLINPCYCHNCENNRQIALEDIYPVYKRIKEPDINKADSLEQRGCDFLELFRLVKFVVCTTDLKTYTNQFDCTIMLPSTTIYASVLQKLTPYFIAECKNEKNAPTNDYFHKLSDILATNESQVGTIFSRKIVHKDVSRIAHQQYLLNRNLPKQRYLLSFNDDDLGAIIYQKVNLLKYIDFKIFELTTNARNATYDMFKQKNN